MVLDVALRWIFSNFCSIASNPNILISKCEEASVVDPNASFKVSKLPYRRAMWQMLVSHGSWLSRALLCIALVRIWQSYIILW